MSSRASLFNASLHYVLILLHFAAVPLPLAAPLASQQSTLARKYFARAAVGTGDAREAVVTFEDIAREPYRWLHCLSTFRSVSTRARLAPAFAPEERGHEGRQPAARHFR